MPEDYLTARVDDYRRQYIEQNCNGDESQLADYVSTYYGKTVEEMEAYWNEGMEKSIRLEFIMDAIADELGVEVNQDDIDTYAEQLVSQNGYESVEAMYNIYGFGDTDYGKRYFADLYRYDQALDQLLETLRMQQRRAVQQTHLRRMRQQKARRRPAQPIRNKH